MFSIDVVAGISVNRGMILKETIKLNYLFSNVSRQDKS